MLYFIYQLLILIHMIKGDNMKTTIFLFITALVLVVPGLPGTAKADISIEENVCAVSFNPCDNTFVNKCPFK